MSNNPEQIWSIRHQTAIPGEVAEQSDGRQSVLERKVCQQFRGTPNDRRRQHHQGARALLNDRKERRLEFIGPTYFLHHKGGPRA